MSKKRKQQKKKRKPGNTRPKRAVADSRAGAGYLNEGMKLHQAGRLAGAEQAYRKALAEIPDHPDALHLLGVSLLQQRKYRDAEPFIAGALKKAPDNPSYHLNLGLTLKGLDRYQEALAAYETALKLNPDYAEAWNCKGTVLNAMGEHRKSIAAFKKALEIRPDYAEAHLNMGNAWQWMGLPGEAIPCYRRAVRIRPDYANAYNSLGNALETVKQKEAALDCFKKVLQLEPENRPAFCSYVHLLQHTCQWRKLNAVSPRMDRYTAEELEAGVKTSQSPFVALARQDDTQLNLKIARAWSDEMKRSLSAAGTGFSFENRRKPEEKLRIGYISSDFRDHPVAHLCAGLFARHNRRRFAVYCYSAGPDDGSDYRRRIRETCDQFTDLRGVGTVDAARRIYEDGVDILVDLSGYTGAHRLDICALRPAPVQASWLGFTGASGGGFMDYIIVDRIVTPEDQADWFTEKFVYMPDCYQICDDESFRPASGDPDRSAENLPENGFVFCSFNAPYKIEPVMFAVWMRILKRAPASTLWLSGMNRTARRKLRQAAESHGVSAKRLVFAGRVPSKTDHLNRHALADLALDTRIFNGHVTTTDALLAGVPVLTCPGRQFASRVAASLLNAAGLSNLVADSLQTYEDTAVNLAGDPEKAAEIRRMLIKNRNRVPFFNTRTFVNHLETAYTAMWRNFAQGRPPGIIDVRRESAETGGRRTQSAPPEERFDLAAALQQALKWHQNGDIENAAAGYKKILEHDPDQPDALNLSGIIEYRKGNLAEAEHRIRRALEIIPDNPGFVNNLGLVLVKRGKPEEAVAYYRRVLSRTPDLPDMNNNLGLALEAAGQSEAAEPCFRRAIQVRPDYAEARFNLGRMLQKSRRTAEAESCYKSVLDINPKHTGALNGLGTIYAARFQFEQAAACFNQGISVSPAAADLWLNLGNAYNRSGRYTEAIDCYRNVLQLNPDHYDALLNMGSACKYIERNKDAENCYRKAVEVRPDGAMGHYNLGTLLRDTDRPDDAAKCYRRALAAEPGHVMAINNLNAILEKECRWEELGKLGRDLDRMSDACLSRGEKTVETPLSNVSRHMDPRRNFLTAQSWSREIANGMAETGIAFAKRPFHKDKLRIGYVSSDFTNHPVAHLTARMFELHDRERFEVFCYGSGKDDDGDEYRNRIKAGCDHFIDIDKMTHPDAARRIHDDGIDILADLNGHTTGGRLEIFALRPAPVNITYLGFPGTTGAAFMDYLITDRIVTPPEHDRWYSEHLIVMPHTFQVNDNTQPVSAPPGRAQAGLPENKFVFCSFNNVRKIEPGVFDTWMRILKQVENSVLWLAKSSEPAKEKLRHEAERRGVTPERLVFAEKLPDKADHLARIGLADLALDTFIYNGHTTTTDALWAGVPVLTRIGAHFASRTSASLLSAAGLNEMIVNDIGAYIEKAADFASNRKKLAAVRMRLQENRRKSPLFDTEGFVKNLENAYDRVKHQHGT